MTDACANTEITVVLADDQDLVRSGFRTIVQAHENLVVIGEASNGQEALDVVGRLQPDVVLMDIRMPIMSGLEAAKIICADRDLADTRVMVVTTFDNDENIFAALKAGVGGFIGKDAAPETLIQAIRTLHAGVGLVFPNATRSLISDHAILRNEEHASSELLRQLTPREREVFELVARGQSNDEIGASLFIGQATVKTHLNRCFMKLEVRDRTQMVILAYEAGVILRGQS